MKVAAIILIQLYMALAMNSFCTAETVDILIKGVDDGKETSKQDDYNEAVMNAKLQAIERAGVEIQSITKVENFVVKYDMIESKAKAVLLPGFQIVDLGYQKDGTYQVVLSGKVEVLKEEIDTKELRYAKLLMDQNNVSKAKEIVQDIIRNSKNDEAVSEALYYRVLWGFASNEKDDYTRLKAYYPGSKYVKLLDDLFEEKEKYSIGHIKKEADFSVGAGQKSSWQLSLQYPDRTLSITVTATLGSQLEIDGRLSLNGYLEVDLAIQGERVWSERYSAGAIAFLGSQREDWVANPEFHTPRQKYVSVRWDKYAFSLVIGSSGKRWEEVYRPRGRIDRAYIRLECVRERL